MAKSRPKYRVLVGMTAGPINRVCTIAEEVYVVQDDPIPECSAMERAELICAALNAYSPSNSGGPRGEDQGPETETTPPTPEPGAGADSRD